jgi:uncharacterized OB-fold protein
MSADVSDEELIARYRDQTVDRDTAHRYRGWLDHRVLINRCADCGRYTEPPTPVCPSCWSWQVQPTEVAGTGRIHMAIFLHQGPPAEGVDYSTPHPVVVVELDEQPGLRYTATVLGASNDEITIGRRVELTWFERAGSPRPAFRLVGPA